LAQLLGRLFQRDGLGIEVVSHVNNIPKGSRLAVSTTLLASLISVCMRATGQAILPSQRGGKLGGKQAVFHANVKWN
jgi:hypothetical protein